MADHPRIRGEHRMLSPGGVFSAGSSPHTRGARCRARAGRGPGGIIPAYAGSTAAWERIASRGGGSSPHTRGAQVDEIDMVDSLRIIPAYAGSTHFS